jgi:cytochrome o ubiquinol oxidase subunit II
MKRIKFVIGILAIIGFVLAIFFVLRSENALVVHPKGIIAYSQLNVITKIILLMLIIIVPTFIALFVIAWKYRAKNSKAEYDPERSYGGFREALLWIIPAIVIAVMAFTTWNDTHKLDPYKQIKSDVKPLKIQVVALDWKWLFIYPEQGIAALNFVQFPAQTPIHFELAADSSPMNSFWIPQLSGQIYAMTGMITQIHMMADEPGEYSGRAAEINGKGYASMTFVVKSTPQADFEGWVEEVKKSSLPLTESLYNKLVKPSKKNPITLYSSVEQDLFSKIVMKYMHPTQKKLWKTSSLENSP